MVAPGDLHSNGPAAADPNGTHTAVWVVVRTGRGTVSVSEPMSLGDAKQMVAGPEGGRVCCAICERQERG